MLKAELLEIILNGQNSGVEFKRDDVRPEQLAKEIVAMANFQGGKLLIGVEDNGTITGIQRADLEAWLMDTVFGRYVHPQILPFYEEIAVDDKKVAVISIAQGTAKPYVVRHKDKEDIYIRVGSTSRHATREQQLRLLESGGLLHAEILPVSGSSFEDLDIMRLQDYLQSRIGDTEIPQSPNAWIERLCGLGLMTSSVAGPPCTIAGIVLFGRSPRHFVRHAGIRWMAFEGVSKEYRALDDTVIDAPMVGLWKTQAGQGRQSIEPGLVERTISRMTPFVSEESDTLVDHVRRERFWKYSPDAMREAIINALVHRDWTRSVELEIVDYADRLEITSAGTMQNAMTIEKMLAGQRSARNPILVEIMRDYNYVDARGMGVRRKIVPLTKELSGKDAMFELTEDYLKVILPAAPKKR
jgi:ATP-dependent DNA helicase RecG